MTTDERQRALAEYMADWEAMAQDRGPRHVVGRALRGIPTAIWIRLSDREITAMPAGLAMTLVGIGAASVGTRSFTFPSPFRHFVIVTSLGLMLVGINFVREPRRLVLRRYRLAGLMAGGGFAGLAATLPTAAQWPYEGPVVESRLWDGALQMSFVIIAVGFLLLVATSLWPARGSLLSVAGGTLMVGIATFGVSLIVWGITMSPVDLPLAPAAVVIGRAALSFVHVLPRLRHLDVVHRDAKRKGIGIHQPWKGTS